MQKEQKNQTTKEIPQSQWSQFFNQLSKAEKRRFLSLEVASFEIGNEKIVKRGSLSSMTCEPLGKGHDLEISIGGDEVLYSHFVKSPKAVWVIEDEADHVMALEIIDDSEAQTIIRFET